MSYLRERIFGQEPEPPRRRGKQTGIAILIILSIAFLLRILWHYGIIAAIWDMICDMARAIADFLIYVLKMRQ